MPSAVGFCSFALALRGLPSLFLSCSAEQPSCPADWMEVIAFSFLLLSHVPGLSGEHKRLIKQTNQLRCENDVISIVFQWMRDLVNETCSKIAL